LALEASPFVRSVAERFIGRVTTAAEGHIRFAGREKNLVAIDIGEFGRSRYQERTIIAHFNRYFRHNSFLSRKHERKASFYRWFSPTWKSPFRCDALSAVWTKVTPILNARRARCVSDGIFH
jgi:hypothetical protein